MIISIIATGKEAQAIVFIPPVIYIATLSLGAFIINISIFIAIWLATQGIINRLYFGKALHQIIRIFLGIFGKAVVLFAASVISILFFNPLNPKEVIISSILAGILCLIFIFLGNFKEYRLVQKKEKLATIGSMLLFFILTAIIIFISASLALKTKILSTGENGLGAYKENLSAPNGFTLPLQKSTEYISKDEAEKGIAPDYKNDAIEDNKSDRSMAQLLWFYPSDFKVCEVYFDTNLILAVHPKNNCYYYDSGKLQKLPCPISVSLDDVPLNLAKADGQYNIYGQGSCVEKYRASITQEGFNMNK